MMLGMKGRKDNHMGDVSLHPSHQVWDQTPLTYELGEGRVGICCLCQNHLCSPLPPSCYQLQTLWCRHLCRGLGFLAVSRVLGLTPAQILAALVLLVGESPKFSLIPSKPRGAHGPFLHSPVSCRYPCAVPPPSPDQFSPCPVLPTHTPG